MAEFFGAKGTQQIRSPKELLMKIPGNIENPWKKLVVAQKKSMKVEELDASG